MVENGFIEIMNKYVEFQEILQIENHLYELIGVTSIEIETNKNSKYKTFLLKEDNEWYEYDSAKVKIVKKQTVLKSCAISLFYKKQEKQSDQEKKEKQSVQEKEKEEKTE